MATRLDDAWTQETSGAGTSAYTVGAAADAAALPARRPLPRAGIRVEPALKRMLDILVSLMVLLLLAPLMAVVALAIVLESRGPIFYRAERVGRNGRAMRMFKFRKMREGAGGLRLTTAHDARLTRVGAILARTKLDELPQFLNVLRGEMSIIGPRPEDPGFVARREADYRRILQVRPGISGLSQIAFAEESQILSQRDPLAHYLADIFPQKCALDRMYAANAGLALDLRILAWSFVAVLLRRQVAVHRETARMGIRRRPVARAATPADLGETATPPMLERAA